MREYQLMCMEDGEWVRDCTITAKNKADAETKARGWNIPVQWKIVCL